MAFEFRLLRFAIKLWLYPYYDFIRQLIVYEVWIYTYCSENTARRLFMAFDCGSGNIGVAAGNSRSNLVQHTSPLSLKLELEGMTKDYWQAKTKIR